MRSYGSGVENASLTDKAQLQNHSRSEASFSNQQASRTRRWHLEGIDLSLQLYHTISIVIEALPALLAQPASINILPQ